MRRYFSVVVLCCVVGAVIGSESCAVRSSACTCTFSDDADGGEGQVAKAVSTTEILAGAAGAMAPLLIGGSVFGIYKLKTGGGRKGHDRSDSRMSNSSSSQPPGYFSRRGSKLNSVDDTWGR